MGISRVNGVSDKCPPGCTNLAQSTVLCCNVAWRTAVSCVWSVARKLKPTQSLAMPHCTTPPPPRQTQKLSHNPCATNVCTCCAKTHSPSANSVPGIKTVSIGMRPDVERSNINCVYFMPREKSSYHHTCNVCRAPCSSVHRYCGMRASRLWWRVLRIGKRKSRLNGKATDA